MCPANRPAQSPAKRSVKVKPQHRRIIVSVATSADGFIARKDGSVDWLDRAGLKGEHGMREFYGSIDTILWGRKTYDFALGYQKNHKGYSAFDKNLKHYVFSRTLQQAEMPAETELVAESIKEFAAKLRATKGKDIWMMGGAEIIAAFLDEGEIDEFSIHVIPMMIGEGIPLVAPRLRNIALKLLSCEKFSDSSLRLHYSVQK
jgi:dihydrofolate reductase